MTLILGCIHINNHYCQVHRFATHGIQYDYPAHSVQGCVCRSEWLEFWGGLVIAVEGVGGQVVEV